MDLDSIQDQLNESTTQELEEIADYINTVLDARRLDAGGE